MRVPPTKGILRYLSICMCSIVIAFQCTVCCVVMYCVESRTACLHAWKPPSLELAAIARACQLHASPLVLCRCVYDDTCWLWLNRGDVHRTRKQQQSTAKERREKKEARGSEQQDGTGTNTHERAVTAHQANGRARNHCCTRNKHMASM